MVVVTHEMGFAREGGGTAWCSSTRALSWRRPLRRSSSAAPKPAFEGFSR